MSLAVSMLGIDKRFDAVHALDKVDLQVEQGTLHAVVGENGAGKTTLMRVLYGALAPDSGSLEVEGKTVRFRRSADAIDAGIGMVSQHYGIIPELTCLQNLMLGAEGGALIDVRQAKIRAGELAAKMGFQFDWDSEASTLSPSGNQKLEILKLLWRNARIMILDEPTAMLSPADGDALFASLHRLIDDGATVLLVTHRLPEVFQHSSRVTILRGGKRVAEMGVSETSPKELAKLIVGGEPVHAVGRDYEPGGASAVTVRDLVVNGTRGDAAVKGVTFSVREGEIVGIAGVDGSGQRELFHALLGVARPRSGEISLARADITSMPTSQRLEAGMRIIPEDRHAEGVIEDWTLDENAALGLQRLPPFARGKSIDGGQRHGEAVRIAERFETKHGGLDQPMSGLSGGNQQRFVAARALELSPKAILAFQPARGLDLNATEHVYQGLRDACKAGAAALVVSFDLDELLAHCDRILVMNRGELFAAPAGKETDREAIGARMVSAT